MSAAAGATPAPATDRGSGTVPLLLALGLANGITLVPNVAIALALPTLHRELDVSTTVLQWTVTGYLLTFSSLLIASGRLADLFGRRRVLTIGAFVFGGASIPGALSGQPIVLIGSLVVTGIGAAMLAPASLALITDAFRGERRATAVGVWGAAGAFLSGIAPAIGGFFTGELSWRWILWLNVGAALAVLAGTRSARESRNDADGRSMDLLGVVCCVGALAGLTLALNESPAEWAWGSTQTIVTLLITVALAVTFVVAEPRLHAPLVDLRMFARRNLSGASLSLLAFNFPLGAVLFFIPVYLQELLGDTPLKAGLLLLPTSVAMAVGMPLGGRLHVRVGPLWPVSCGMVLSAVAMLLLSGVDSTSGYGAVWPGLTLLGIGIGLALTPLNLTALGAVPQRLHAAVGGILTTIGGVGTMLGVAVSGAVFESLQLHATINDAAQAGVDLSQSTASTLERPAGGGAIGRAGAGRLPRRSAGCAARRGQRRLRLRAGHDDGAVGRDRRRRAGADADADPPPARRRGRGLDEAADLGQVGAHDAQRPRRVPRPAGDVLAAQRRVRIVAGDDVADLLAGMRGSVDTDRVGQRLAHAAAAR